MNSLDCLWADRHSLIKFFNDAPNMDVCARLHYFHDIFPYAELLPVNFYLIDSKDTNVACNQTTLEMLGDKCITEYFGLSFFEYSSRKGWPRKMAEIQIDNNNRAFLNRQAVVCQEFSLLGNDEIKWQSKKEPIFDDNGLPVGIVGISSVIGYGNKFIYWDGEKKRIVILFSVNNPVEFSLREFCVLKGLLNGSTAEEIASQENISHKTIETYLMRVKLKLNCPRLRDVISFCIKTDLAKNIIEFSNDIVKH